ncbi:leucyl/phenylalanyl-tRNA--protein transferase [Curvivirga aplysinae]|uniref:leucyl/phenylalanyl-tRNA--protein transferase n=1 Tax=Curvivirga aplysinae TaxID=2529852 RepID=UPI0012BB751F|nr:leucyl/phenylalanyl-tRNA--protein transferase [Curvivirga aplysinae]MTI09211.1 leucyl/phenylalanyl-tRNA--protein transferase [Curvivirga aplysinae]
MEPFEITPEVLIKAYAVGVFPMAEDRDDEELFWVDPRMRGVIPFDEFHVPRRLKRTIRQQKYNVTFNKDFVGVMEGCAEETTTRPRTWINNSIFDLYTSLHMKGCAHSVEVWDGENLIGGLYGVSLGGAFFGESMFSRAADTSKIALVHLISRLVKAKYTLLDTQFITDHLSQFGAKEIPRDEYRDLLENALRIPTNFARNYEKDEAIDFVNELSRQNIKSSQV